jgi:hypothetical protein
MRCGNAGAYAKEIEMKVYSDYPEAPRKLKLAAEIMAGVCLMLFIAIVIVLT